MKKRLSQATRSASFAGCRINLSKHSSRRSMKRCTPICFLHVVDSASPVREEQIHEVNAVLADIEADNVPVLLVYNKIDLSGNTPEIVRDENGGAPKAVFRQRTHGGGARSAALCRGGICCQLARRKIPRRRASWSPGNSKSKTTPSIAARRRRRSSPSSRRCFKHSRKTTENAHDFCKLSRNTEVGSSRLRCFA